ncbi:hypothetical protein LCGC14_0968290 [marine sediment metagenome]|uniref:DNA/pantothenate metabolism flavoprotein C-terminal domain-containing protein n=1 Tax=marine sediment metagenome TaxID=412755 RepID=A0A0F9NGX3_9ZZZZ
MQKKVLVTAGPTREAIDPVRYISNKSSGKTGYAIANEFVLQGASVRLVSGPVSVEKPALVEIIDVETAEQMKKAIFENYEWADIVIMAAAVADFKPKLAAKQKIKKSSELTIELEKTSDILEELGKNKKHQRLVGFALETENLLENAEKKLKEKNLDLVIANNEKAINSKKADFVFVDNSGTEELKSISKEELAKKIAKRFL